MNEETRMPSCIVQPVAAWFINNRLTVDINNGRQKNNRNIEDRVRPLLIADSSCRAKSNLNIFLSVVFPTRTKHAKFRHSVEIYSRTSALYAQRDRRRDPMQMYATSVRYAACKRWNEQLEIKTLFEKEGSVEKRHEEDRGKSRDGNKP